MSKIVIVGGGFSAALARLFISQPTRIITPSKYENNYLFFPKRRKNLEVNKFFLKKANSFGSLSFKLKNSKLHDRLIFGGNSQVWGGFFETKGFRKNILDYIQNSKIFFKKLNFDSTGCISNNKKLYQLHDHDGKIFDARIIIKKHDEYMLHSFSLNKARRIRLKLVAFTENQIKYRYLMADKLILCVGTIQLIDLLYRSEFLKNHSELSLTECDYQLRIKICFRPENISKGSVIIRYQLFRALNHFLGIQDSKYFLKVGKYIPIYLDQVFKGNKNNLHMVLNDKTIEIKNKIKNNSNFGRSIHYCNLKINNKPINQLFQEISKNILGFGMPFVTQKKGGPISNIILKDILQKIKVNNLGHQNLI